MSARFPLSLRLFFTTCLCLCVCLAAGCSGKQVHVTVENEFNMMAKRLAPVLKAHGVIDEHGAYVAPVFSTPELPPQLGEYLFQRLSPAFRFKVDPALLPPTFALSRTAGDTVEMQPYGFMLGQGADIVTVTLLAQTDWNDDGLNEWLLLCRVKPIIGKNNMRDYYLLVEKPGASILVPKLLAVYDCLSQSCKLFVDVDQKKPPYAPEEPTIEVKIGQKDVTLPPNAPPPPGAPQHEFKESRIVFAGTRQIYGKPDYLPVDEKHPVRPVDVNGINKMAGEWYHILYNNVYGIRACSLRLTNTIGPRMRIKDARQTFLGVWIRQVLTGKPFEVWGGEQLRDFTYVDDCVDAMMRAALHEEAFGQIFNIGGGKRISLRDLADLLVDTAGEGAYEVREYPADRKKIDIGDYYADDSRLRSLLGWEPRTQLRDGLRQIIDYYRPRLQDYL